MNNRIYRKTNKIESPNSKKAMSFISLGLIILLNAHADNLVLSGNEGFYTAENANQNWQVHYANDGMTTITNQHHRIGIKLISAGSQRIEKTPAVEVQGHTLYYHHSPSLKEWWVNSTDKTQHRFGLRSRPITGSHLLKLKILLITENTINQADKRLSFISKQSSTINYNHLKAWDLHGHVLPSRMRLAKDRTSFTLLVDDRLANYPITINHSFHRTNHINPIVNDSNNHDRKRQASHTFDTILYD